MKTKQSKKSAGEVWFCYGDRDMTLQGYIVSESGHPEKLIAYVHFGDGAGSDMEGAFAECKAIAKNPSRVAQCHWMVDMRDAGKLDSRRPIPGFIYEWMLAKPGEYPPANNSHIAVFITPFCRFRVAKMLGFSIENGDLSMTPVRVVV